jgi:hypothetical protein
LLRALRRRNEVALTTGADRSSFFIALVVVDVFVGLADALSGPYLVLFLVGEARQRRWLGSRRHGEGGVRL